MERNFKYKVGDRVIATDNCNFNKKKPGTIVELWHHSDHPSPYRVKFDDHNGICMWSEVHSLIVPKQKIVVTTDGTKITTAKLYENGKVVKTTEAKCCPEDTFDFNVGANLAINRLIGKPICAGEEKKEDNPVEVDGFKVGDRVNHYGHNGTVICINYMNQLGVEFDDSEYGLHDCGAIPLKAGTTGTKMSSRWCLAKGLTHGEVPTYYNGKVVCVDNKFNRGTYTIGKIYQFVDGVLTSDNGCKIRKENPCKSFKDFDNWTGSKFIEVVE